MDLSVPCGKFHTRYRQDKAVIRSRSQWGLLIGFLVFMLVLPMFVNNAWLSVVNKIGIWVVAIMGLNILTGYCGLISMGQFAFMGIGAYTCGILAASAHMPFWLTIPCAGLVAGLVGIIFGLPAVRIKGFYLVMATISAHYIFNFAILHLPRELAGRETGLSVPAASLGGFVFNSEPRMFYFILFFAVLAVFLGKNIIRTKTGRAFVAIRDNDLAAQSIGVNLFGYKLIAFFICSAFAGVAGAVWAYYVRYIGIEQFQLWYSVWLIGMLIVGGMGSIVGGIFGVIFLKFFEEMVTVAGPLLDRLFPEMGGGIVFSAVNVMFGLVIMLFLIFEPKGLAHRWELFKAYYRLFPYKY
ncbi:MAG: branched-chain amino acid ABC transporter permease [Proteobacteria bacterium]|nr:branched-chain amino acid ABC transporter permease [Pseudomonadota bacterium]